ncbi:MAG: Asp-tRNA(Asn)/Glu-tRNA(Gln) amidotransferase GatCAB subunit B, partial [Thermoanaerobacterales bacterium]|nr:Asp-tRNA(Asn)/Glu-tRNA(Gln) amidotransferase GatCAB subunit B [Thermoanaerobacterales bacterium]
LTQITDESALAAVVDQVVAANPKSVNDYRGGKTNALGFLVGQVMKATRGKANPALVNKLLREKLD